MPDGHHHNDHPAQLYRPNMFTLSAKHGYIETWAVCRRQARAVTNPPGHPSTVNPID